MENTKIAFPLKADGAIVRDRNFNIICIFPVGEESDLKERKDSAQLIAELLNEEWRKKVQREKMGA